MMMNSATVTSMVRLKYLVTFENTYDLTCKQSLGITQLLLVINHT
jgi:hypothetical protein